MSTIDRDDWRRGPGTPPARPTARPPTEKERIASALVLTASRACVVCGRDPVNVPTLALRRLNQRGETGVWICTDDLAASPLFAPDTQAQAEAIVDVVLGFKDAPTPDELIAAVVAVLNGEADPKLLEAFESVTRPLDTIPKGPER